MQRIYLDNNSTTSVDPRVIEVIQEELNSPPSNPSSNHTLGRSAKAKLMQAREECASFFHAKPDEITFTASGTEAINLMLKGLKKKGHIITTNCEHASIDQTMHALEKEGFSVTFLSPGLLGAPTPSQIEGAIQEDTVAIVLSLSNGETGVRIDIKKIADIALKHDIPLLLDGVSFIGKEPYVPHPGITAVAISAHKFHGPKGVGLLYHKKTLPLMPIITGGSQEYQLRAGTENLGGILGLTRALAILKEEQATITKKILDLRTHFEKELSIRVPEAKINGEGDRISNISNIAFSGIDGETLLIQLDMAGIAASHGSACSSGASEPSRILLNMGIDRKRANSSVRFSFARTNTLEEIEKALSVIASIANAFRKKSEPGP